MKLHEALDHFRQAFQDAPIGIALVGVDAEQPGRFLDVNPAFCAITGYPRDQLLRRHDQDITHPGDLAVGRDLEKKLALGQVRSFQIDKRYLHADGDIVWVSSSASLISDADGRPECWLTFVLDETAGRQTESARQQARQELADAHDQAQAASKTQSEFLATMSHELRTPLNGVIGLTGLLLDTELTESQRHHAEWVRASGEALLSIIDDILDFSEIEAGRLELKSVDFDLNHAVEEVALLVAESARAKDLELVAYCRPEVPTALRGDVGRLRQILLNFATNAVKFTAAGEVVLRAGLAEEPGPDGVTLRVEVADTGTLHDGSGLPRSPADLVRAVSAPPTEASDRPSSSTRVAPGSRGTLLIVDDHAVNQEVARGIVAKLGFGSDVAGDGVEALDSLALRRYDAVLMDCHMPEMDGFQATAEIRRRETGQRHVPIIAMTGGADREKCLAAGMDDYLSKPVKEQQLAAMLDRWLGTEAETAPASTAPGRTSGVGDADGVVDDAQFDALRRLSVESGDPGLLRSLVDLFADQATSQLAELRETAGEGDASKLQEVAHSLKGASATMGAIGVASASAEIEAAASRGEVAGLGELDRITRALESATVALRARAPDESLMSATGQRRSEDSALTRLP